MSDTEMIEKIRQLLPDEFTESKDWKEGNLIERIEWLKQMLKSKTEEVEMWMKQL